LSAGIYIEDTLVQQATGEYFEQQFGWESVNAYNNKDSSSDHQPARLSVGK